MEVFEMIKSPLPTSIAYIEGDYLYVNATVVGELIISLDSSSASSPTPSETLILATV